MLRKARSKSAAGPNGVPYKLYKNCPGVAKLMWHYMKVIERVMEEECNTQFLEESRRSIIAKGESGEFY